VTTRNRPNQTLQPTPSRLVPLAFIIKILQELASLEADWLVTIVFYVALSAVMIPSRSMGDIDRPLRL
jgi:hypothetical protein